MCWTNCWIPTASTKQLIDNIHEAHSTRRAVRKTAQKSLMTYKEYGAQIEYNDEALDLPGEVIGLKILQRHSHIVRFQC